MSNKTIYVVQAYRWGKRENHSYVVGVYDTVPFTVKEVIYKSVDGKWVLPIGDITGETIQPKIKHEGIDFNLWKYKNWIDEWEIK